MPPSTVTGTSLKPGSVRPEPGSLAVVRPDSRWRDRVASAIAAIGVVAIAYLYWSA